MSSPADAVLLPELEALARERVVGAARKAGRSLARDFGEVEQLQVSLKGPANFVSAADTRAEEILHKELCGPVPAMASCLKSMARWKAPTGPIASSSIRSTAPPTSCTAFRIFAISIALERNGELVAGLIYNPASNEMFTAERGKGAFLNDRRSGSRHEPSSPMRDRHRHSASRQT